MKNWSVKRIFLGFILFLLPIQELQSNDNHFNLDRNTQTAINLTTLITLGGYATYQYAQQPIPPFIKVKNLATTRLNFPSNFEWGVATSSTQNEESGHNNSWAKSYLQTIPGKEDVTSPNFACKSWEHWQDDIDKVINLGCNSYRISIEWSRVEPSPGKFDQSAINHYVKIAQYCKDHNIQLMVCLHHYSDPIWFMNQGGFAKEENIPLFTEYCKTMYENLNKYVSQWIVISQPVAYAVKGYKVAMQPPFLKNSGLEETVMLNMFKSHIAVYNGMHSTYNITKKGKKPSVGLCHQIVQMKAANPLNPIEQLVALFADRLYNQTLLRTFTDGHFQSLTPMIDIAYLPQAPSSFDFFALSYYSPLSFTGIKSGSPKTTEDLTTADTGRVIDKDGMYDAIVQASKLGKPVYVVENGINPKTEGQRELLLNSYLSAISQTITDGYDVRGYLHWTLMDDYE